MKPMPITVRNLRMELSDSEDALLVRVARRLKLPADAIARYAVVRRSLDARRSDDIYYSCNIQLALAEETDERRIVSRLHRDDVQFLERTPPPANEVGTDPAPSRPVIVGFGPAGMFAALLLAEHGYRPIVLERGRDVTRRHRDILQRFYRDGDFDPESNLLYGEGGAGTYSDGKLYTRLHDTRIDLIMRTFFRFGADPDVLIDGRPHIGSDKLPNICRRIRQHIESLGGEIRFEKRVAGLDIREGCLNAVLVGDERIDAAICILAIGHSARDTYRMLAEAGVKLAPKPYQIGLRIEHTQESVNRWQYGASASRSELPPADYHLVAKQCGPDQSDVFSFCMCPGGEILLTNESAGLIATNGASRSRRNGPFANSGLVVTRQGTDHGDDPLAAIAYQQSWEARAFERIGRQYLLPCQRASDFLANRPSEGALTTSCPLGAAWADLREIVPQSVHESIARALSLLDARRPGYAGPEAILTGPETRGSAPVRILRDAVTRESATVGGLYPVGEGAGYAGGIISSAVDGLKSAESIMARYAPAR